MSSFFKVVLQNIAKGPSTIKYPFEDSPAPEKLRGKIKHDPESCLACRLCEHVCAAGAIKIQECEDNKGIDFVVWHNSCTFCGLCEFYCPTGAIHLTNDYHTAHLQAEKYDYCERTHIEKGCCERCGEPIMPMTPKMIEKVYGKEGDIKGLSKLCPKCRRIAAWEDNVI